jgi:hypothetical protein
MPDHARYTVAIEPLHKILLLSTKTEGTLYYRLVQSLQLYSTLSKHSLFESGLQKQSPGTCFFGREIVNKVRNLASQLPAFDVLKFFNRRHKENLEPGTWNLKLGTYPALTKVPSANCPTLLVATISPSATPCFTWII